MALDEVFELCDGGRGPQADVGGHFMATGGGDGVTGTPVVQDIFGFLGAWFAGGC